MRKFSLTCFGVGDGWPCADRHHSSFLYRFGRTAILIDAGESVSRSYKARGLSYDLVDGFFLSHLHADHCGGLFMLLQGMWLERRRKELTLHLPGQGVQPLRAMLKATTIYEELLAFRLRFRPLHAGRSVRAGDVRVTPFPTTHLAALQAQFGRQRSARLEAFCFLIQHGGVRVGHSADLGSPQDLAPLLAQPLDLLLCELAHFSIADICAYLRGRDIGRVAFVHLSREHWENLSRTRRRVARLLPDMPCTFPRDGDTVAL